MRTVSESLAHALFSGAVIACPYSQAKQHPYDCTCMGTGKVIACQDCAGSGWNAPENEVCRQCHGRGALATAVPKK